MTSSRPERSRALSTLLISSIVVHGRTLTKYPLSSLPTPRTPDMRSSEITSPSWGTHPPQTPVLIPATVIGLPLELLILTASLSSESSTGMMTCSPLPVILDSSVRYLESLRILCL